MLHITFLTSLDPPIHTTGHKRRCLSSVPTFGLTTIGKYLQLHESTKSLPPICWGSRKLHVPYNRCTATNELTRDCYVV